MIKRGKENKIVERLLMIAHEKAILNDQVSIQICCIVCYTVPSVVHPEAILIVCEIEGHSRNFDRYWKVTFDKSTI
jgi:hypothetical protein